MTPKRSAKALKVRPVKATKSILHQVYPLVVAYREVEKLDWLVTGSVLQALSDKAMQLLVSSLGD